MGAQLVDFLTYSLLHHKANRDTEEDLKRGLKQWKHSFELRRTGGCGDSEVFWCCFTGVVFVSPLQMTEGRLCQVHLLDDRKLELLVQVRHPFNLFHIVFMVFYV